MRNKLYKVVVLAIMVLSLFLVCDVCYAKENKIELNSEKFDIDNHTFSYPKLSIDDSISPYSVTVAIENGYFNINNDDITTYFDYKGGTNDLNAFVSTLKTDEKYIVLSLNLKSTSDVKSTLVKDSVSEFLRNIKFFSEIDKDAKVTISISEVKLEFTNEDKNLKNIGVIAFKDPNSSKVHYYAEIKETNVEYMTAYKAAASSTFNGLQGYLLTITSDAEHNFVHNAYENVHTWFGAAAITNYENAVYNSPDSEFTPASGVLGRSVSYKANTDNDVLIEKYWRWISGPEAGQPILVDGSYNKFHSGEPNNTNNNEWCGMYGADNHGDWYDFPNTSYLIKGYYIEFGGFDNDNETVKPALVESTFKWEDYVYKFTSGDNQVLTLDNIDKFIITTNGDYSLFKSITIGDLDLVKDNDYNVTDGSTIITFTDKGIAKLNTLSKGEYEIVINYTNDEVVKGKLTINQLEPKKEEEPVPEEKEIENPKTNDDSILYFVVGGVSLIGVLGYGIYLSKKKYN